MLNSLKILLFTIILQAKKKKKHNIKILLVASDWVRTSDVPEENGL